MVAGGRFDQGRILHSWGVGGKLSFDMAIFGPSAERRSPTRTFLGSRQPGVDWMGRSGDVATVCGATWQPKEAAYSWVP